MKAYKKLNHVCFLCIFSIKCRLLNLSGVTTSVQRWQFLRFSKVFSLFVKEIRFLVLGRPKRMNLEAKFSDGFFSGSSYITIVNTDKDKVQFRIPKERYIQWGEVLDGYDRCDRTYAWIETEVYPSKIVSWADLPAGLKT